MGGGGLLFRSAGTRPPYPHDRIRCMDPDWWAAREGRRISGWKRARVDQSEGCCCLVGRAGGIVRMPISAASWAGSRAERVASQYLGASSM